MDDLIPIDRILPNPEQPRTYFDWEGLEELAASIREQGLIQPIVVEKLGKDYILHDGERRLRACKLAGLQYIRAVVEEGQDMDPRARLERAVVANIQRDDLNPIDEAKAYERMRSEFGMSQNKIAIRVGKSLARINQRLQLLALDKPIQNLIADGLLYTDFRLANALRDIPNKEARIKLAKSLAQSGVKLSEAIFAANNVRSAVSAGSEISSTATPAIQLAKRRTREDRLPLPEWDILHQIGRVPPWQVVADAAMATCDNCGLRPVASEDNCRQCPAVEMLSRLLKIVDRGPNGH